MLAFERILIAVGAIVATLLQVFLAPHIPIGYAMPNFMVAYCLAIAVLRAEAFGPVLPFVMGLLYDLIGGGPVGAMAFTLTAVSFAAAALYKRLNNDTLFMPLATLVVSVLVVELVYGVFFLLFGYAAGVMEALVYRALPCFVYDLVISVVVYLVLARLTTSGDVIQPEIRQLH